MLWVAGAVALAGLAAWRARPGANKKASVGGMIAMGVVGFDFALVVVMVLSLLSPRPDMLAFFLFYACAWLLVPHIAAVVPLLLTIGTMDHAFRRARIFFATLGILTPLVGLVGFEIASGWSFSDLFTPEPERLS